MKRGTPRGRRAHTRARVRDHLGSGAEAALRAASKVSLGAKPRCCCRCRRGSQPFSAATLYAHDIVSHHGRRQLARTEWTKNCFFYNFHTLSVGADCSGQNQIARKSDYSVGTRFGRHFSLACQRLKKRKKISALRVFYVLRPQKRKRCRAKCSARSRTSYISCRGGFVYPTNVPIFRKGIPVRRDSVSPFTHVQAAHFGDTGLRQ